MAFLVGKPTALKVARETKRELNCDGGVPYLQVSGEGGCRKSWIFVFDSVAATHRSVLLSRFRSFLIGAGGDNVVIPLGIPTGPSEKLVTVLSGVTMSTFALYIAGFVVLLCGLAYGAFLLHVPHTWIVVGALVIVGFGIMSAVTRTKRRDPPSEPPSP